MISLKNALLLSLPFSAAPAWGVSHAPRPLVIRADGDRVLACIPSDEGNNIEVTDVGVSPVSSVNLPPPAGEWRIELNAGSKPLVLKPSQCLAFGSALSGYTTKETSDLREEQPYYFAIRALNVGSYGTRIHVSDFCISRAGGSLKVAQIPNQPESVTRETCRKLLGVPSDQPKSRD